MKLTVSAINGGSGSIGGHIGPSHQPLAIRTDAAA